jgi:hypothetical protein
LYVAQGRYAEACPKFADSQALDASPSTLLNLASCYEKLGRKATAWATYKEAASAASAANRADYVATAQRHADALAQKLSRVTVTAAAPADGMEVKLDGAPVRRSEWGVAVPIDAGAHTLDAAAPGKKPWSQAFDVKDDASTQSLTVPPLEDAPPAAASAGPSSQGSAGGSPASAMGGPGGSPPAAGGAPGADTSGSDGSTQRIIGIVVGGAGVVSLGVGAFFAASAKSQYNDSLQSCSSVDKNVCNETGVAKRNDARTAGNVATVLVGAGAAALVAGGILFFTAPHRREAQAARAARFEVVPAIGRVPEGSGRGETIAGAVVRGLW